MDGQGGDHTKGSESEEGKDHTASLTCGIENTKRNLFINQKETHRPRRQTYGYQRRFGGREGRIMQEPGIGRCPPLHLPRQQRGPPVQRRGLSPAACALRRSRDPVDRGPPGPSAQGTLAGPRTTARPAPLPTDSVTPWTAARPAPLPTGLSVTPRTAAHGPLCPQDS